MKRLITLFLLAAYAALLLAACVGCRGYVPPKEQAPAFQAQDHEYVLSVVVDMSPSYSQHMQEDGRAYRFLMKVMKSFFQKRVGTNDRVIISQISGPGDPVLWAGSPYALRKRFTSADKFNEFLNKNKTNGGSFIHRGIASSIEFMIDMPSVKNGISKSAILILTDMEDFGDPESDIQKDRLIKALEDYAALGTGTIGFFWVSRAQTPTWRKILCDAKFKSYVVESIVVEDPEPPYFPD